MDTILVDSLKEVVGKRKGPNTFIVNTVMKTLRYIHVNGRGCIHIGVTFTLER